MAEAAVQLGKMLEHPNLSQPNPGLKADGSTCTVIASTEYHHPNSQDESTAAADEVPTLPTHLLLFPSYPVRILRRRERHR